MINNNIFLLHSTIKSGKDEENQNKSSSQKENNFLNESDGFFMTVNCGIMQDAGISKGDTIMVNKIMKPINGNVVVASVSGDVLIRFYQKIRAIIFLSGDAGKVSPIQVENGFEHFEILGVVTHVVKRL